MIINSYSFIPYILCSKRTFGSKETCRCSHCRGKDFNIQAHNEESFLRRFLLGACASFFSTGKTKGYSEEAFLVNNKDDIEKQISYWIDGITSIDYTSDKENNEDRIERLFSAEGVRPYNYIEGFLRNDWTRMYWTKFWNNKSKPKWSSMLSNSSSYRSLAYSWLYGQKGKIYLRILEAVESATHIPDLKSYAKSEIAKSSQKDLRTKEGTVSYIVGQPSWKRSDNFSINVPPTKTNLAARKEVKRGKVLEDLESFCNAIKKQQAVLSVSLPVSLIFPSGTEPETVNRMTAFWNDGLHFAQDDFSTWEYDIYGRYGTDLAEELSWLLEKLVSCAWLCTERYTPGVTERNRMFWRNCRLLIRTVDMKAPRYFKRERPIHKFAIFKMQKYKKA